ncbi:MAG: hypothetical protein Q7K57_31340 [Burkholderiaceae bacterium]|nr:hypothetical protein [Burkholderiaceae bacterium]
MSIITFQDFARNFTRLSVVDFKAASDRYFGYRGMDRNNEMVEKHFLEFLHFLDLEEIFQSKLPSASRDSVIGISIDANSQKKVHAGDCHELHVQTLPKSASRVERALIKI